METCDQCRFDSRDWTVLDLIGTLHALGPWWEELVRWVDPALLTRRPEPGTWSALEYAIHSRDLTADLGRLVHAVLTVDGLDLRLPPLPDAGPDDEAAEGALTPVIAAIGDNATRLAGRALRVEKDEWTRTAFLDGEPVSATDVLAHAVHDATHHLMDVGRGLHRLGAGPERATGRVASINVSDGGVPKRAADKTTIGKRGVEGDRQAARKHHGRPWQALCLWSAEVIDRLRGEGHPIGPGAAGENITVTGLDWTQVRPCVRLRIGGALVETSLYALPCKKNAQWFAGGDFRRMEHTRERGVSRMYAWVLEDGVVAAGDAVVMEP